MMDFTQREITDFFEQSSEFHAARHTYMETLPLSGYALIDRIPAQAHVLDVGCGKNLFKPHFANLVGIDVIGDESDIRINVMNYHSDQKFDVVLCLGSILGSLNDIRQKISHIKTLMSPGGKIFWRNHPAVPSEQFPKFFYPWTEDTHVQLSAEMGFTLNEVCKEYPIVDGKTSDAYRIYAEWTLN